MVKGNKGYTIEEVFEAQLLFHQLTVYFPLFLRQSEVQVST